MTAMPTVTRPTGLSLRLQRVARDVRAMDLAAQMGVSPGRISRIESQRVVTEATAKRYLEALSTFPTVATPVEGPEAA